MKDQLVANWGAYDHAGAAPAAQPVGKVCSERV